MTAPSPTADGEALGRMMRDLVALSALPNVWHRSEPLEVARSLAAVLEKALPLAVVGVLLETADRGEDSLVVRSGGRLLQWTDAAAVVQILEPAFGLAERAPETLADPFGRGAIRLVCLPIAWQAGRWLLFAASEAPNFPSPGERLLLFAGANHAAVALERHLAFRLLRDSEERFRVSEEQWRTITRQSEESAESASRDKDELLASVSHEIRTPMNAILGMTGLALDSQLTHEQRGWLETVKVAGEHLLVLVNGLLDFSKGEARKATLDPAEFSVRSELASMMRGAAVRAQHKNLELICDVDDDVADRLIGDAGKLRQVLLNLVDNAIKFTPHGEVQVLVTSSEADGAPGRANLTFSVTDTGIGIPAHLHAVIFEAFAQADSSTTRRFGGTGLGLTIAARLTALMGGHIAVASEPNVGSSFTFCLAFQRAGDAAPVKPAEGQWPGLRVLVVDDNPAARALLVRWLSDWHIDASAVADGLSAIETMMASAQSGRPVRLLLVDGSAPGLPPATPQPSVRWGVAHELRLVVLDAGLRTAGPGGAREAVIQKPLMKDELYAAIHRLLSRAEGAAPVPSPPRATPRTTQSRRVLVAEDDDFNVMLTRELLSRRGHAVHVVRSGTEALAELERVPYDLLVLDLHMPEMDGFEVIRILRAREQVRGGHLPVVALTARARPADRERCLAAGMDDFLAKPINSAALVETVERVSRLGVDRPG